MGQASGNAASDPVPSLYRWTYRALGLLAFQFALGMWVNLFGAFPDSATFGGLFLFQGDAPLLVHVTVAALLLGTAAVTVALSLGRGVPWGARVLVAVGGIGVVVAAVFGYLFLASGYATDGYSYGMALGFLLAVLGYAMALAPLALATARSAPVRG